MPCPAASSSIAHPFSFIGGSPAKRSLYIWRADDEGEETLQCHVVLCCVVADEDSSTQPFDLLPLPLPFRVIPVARQREEVRPENGSGSEPIAEAATSSVYTTTAGDGGGSGRAGDGSSDAKAGCPGAGGRRETDAVRVVLLELDTSLGLRSRPRKGVPPRPRPRPPRPPPRRGRETTIFLRDRSNACTECVWRVGGRSLPSSR